MKRQTVLVDAGPLVAFLNQEDQYHPWVISQFATMTPPLLTCEAVVSEACFLLRHYENGVTNLLKLVENKLLTIPFRLEDEISATRNLINKYSDVPMSLADGCLVRMSEQITDGVVFTLDFHFKIYRKNKRDVIPTIMPSS